MKTSFSGLRRRSILLTILTITSVLVKIASLFPSFIERFYSTGIYPPISHFYQYVFGWVPFSIGDLLYSITAIILIITVVKLVKIWKSGKATSKTYKIWLANLLIILLITYIYFNLAWGLNYNRQGIAQQLNLDSLEYKKADLKLVSALLVNKVNEKRLSLRSKKIVGQPHKVIFDQASGEYSSIAKSFPFFKYPRQSIKPSLFGELGTLLGISGYFNPFTGEAQVNVSQPAFLLPFVTCHEMAHQLGYASESEANFVGFLVASNSKDSLFQYAAYFDLFNYANRELYYRDSAAAKENYRQLDTLVKWDKEELYRYWQKSDNLVEPIIKLFYDRYLKANQQTEGIRSYNEVTGWLIAYYRKYGRI